MNSDTTPGNYASVKNFGTRCAEIAETIIFESRWILAPLYALIVVGMIKYFGSAILSAFVQNEHNIARTERDMIMLIGMVDMTMVGNLAYMVAIGGYSIFVREINFHNKANRPRFLNNINSGTLKVKMSMSLVGVSSVHLLKDFIDASVLGWDIIGKRLAIHGIFVISTLGLVWVDRLLHAALHDDGKTKDKPTGGKTSTATAETSEHDAPSNESEITQEQH